MIQETLDYNVLEKTMDNLININHTPSIIYYNNKEEQGCFLF